MRITDLIFSAIYLLVLGIGITQISHLSDTTSTVISSHLFPWLVLGGGLVMGVLETARVVFVGEAPDAPSLRTVWARAFSMRRLTLLALFIVYLFAITSVGFVGATAVFCFATIMVLTPRRSLKEALIAAAISGATIAGIYALLVVYLQAFLP